MQIILIADHGIAQGGAPQVAIQSAAALAKAGAKVIFVHGVGEAADPLLREAGIQTIGLGGVDIHEKPALAALRDGLWNRAPLARLGQILAAARAQAPDETIVHVHQWTKFFSPSLFAVLGRAKMPIALSMHDYFAICPTGLMFRFDLGAPCSLKPLSRACLLAPCDKASFAHKSVRVMRTALARQVMPARPSIIHVSAIGQATIGTFLPADANEHILPNPITLAKPEGPAGGGEKIVFCGRLVPEKGVELLAEATAKAGLPVLFLGEGPSQARIRALNPQAEISGWLPATVLRARLTSEARLLVAPSLWPETGPMVVEEALGLGVPVIISERAGAAASVVAGETGLVIPPSVEGILSALEAIEAPGRVKRMGEAAFARFWADPPDAAAHARRLLAIYRATINDFRLRRDR